MLSTESNNSMTLRAGYIIMTLYGYLLHYYNFNQYKDTNGLSLITACYHFDVKVYQF